MQPTGLSLLVWAIKKIIAQDEKKIDRGLFDPPVSPGGNFFSSWAILVPLVGQPHITYFPHAFPDISHHHQLLYTIDNESTPNYCMGGISLPFTSLIIPGINIHSALLISFPTSSLLTIYHLSSLSNKKTQCLTKTTTRERTM